MLGSSDHNTENLTANHSGAPCWKKCHVPRTLKNAVVVFNRNSTEGLLNVRGQPKEEGLFYPPPEDALSSVLAESIITDAQNSTKKTNCRAKATTVIFFLLFNVQLSSIFGTLHILEKKTHYTTGYLCWFTIAPEPPSVSSVADKAHVLGIVWLWWRTIVGYLFEDCHVPRKLKSSFSDFIKDIFPLRLLQKATFSAVSNSKFLM